MRYFSCRVMVVHLGHVLDVSRAAEVLLPPDIEARLWAEPFAGPKVTRKRIVLKGDITSAVNRKRSRGITACLA